MHIKSENKFKTVFKLLILFPIAVIFSIVVVISCILSLILMVIPLFLYKKLIGSIAKLRWPGCKMLAVVDNVLAKGNVYLQRDQYICVQWDFEGKMDFKEFVALWEERVMQKRRDCGKFMFPELKCYIETWGGYSFYRKDENFDLANHIVQYNEPHSNAQIIDHKELAQIKNKFLHEVFVDKKSPWKILMVHNYRKEDGKECTVVFKKFHHSLGDAYCGLLVFWKCLLLQPMDGFNTPKSSIKQNILTKLVVTISSTFEFFKISFRKAFQFIYDPDALYDNNAWHSSEISDKVYCAMKPIESSLVKEISRAHNVSVTTVLLAISSGALKRMMVAKGFEPPEQFRTAFSLPLPNHPEKLQTHATATQFMLNIQNPDDKKRLNLIEEEMKTGVRTSLLFVTQLGIFLMNSFPFAVKKYAKPGRKVGSTMFNATIPLPPLANPDFEFLGCRLDAFYSLVEVLIYNLTAIVNIVKFKQSFYFNYGIQKHYLKDENEVYDIENYVLEELHHLRTSAVV